MRFWYLSVLLVLVAGCHKFLDKPADASVQIPSTVAVFQGMMDQKVLTALSTPGLGPVYMTDYRPAASLIPAMDSFLVGLYTWQPALFRNGIELSWSNPYKAIYICNTVLTELPKLTGLDSTDAASAAFVMGQAYFVRALLYYYLEETFGQPYRPATASVDMGVPLRLTEDVMATAPRASVAAVYKQIMSDLNAAVSLLPAAVQTNNKNRPSRPAAYGLLARVLLTEQDFKGAKLAADGSLGLYDSLVDLNLIDSNSARPFPNGNCEVMFQCSAYNYPLQYGRSVLVDSNLYGSYAQNDLRRVVYFGLAVPAVPASMESGGGAVAGYYFKGQYTGLVYLFSGVAVDDVYFTRAESEAWMNDLSGAVADVNAVLVMRWRHGSFVPYSAVGLTRDSVLRIVLTEKRKETVFREGPFFDLRRLNQYPAFADTLSRVFGGQIFTLLPGSPRYAFPIPQQEIDAGGVVQNPE